MAEQSGELRIVESSPDAAAVKQLIGELSAALATIAGADERGSFAGWEPSPRSVFVMAMRGNEPVGCGALSPLDGETAEIERMYAKYPRQGIGRAILAYLEGFARKAGFARIRLELRAVNEDACRFYLMRGYSRIDDYGRYAGRDECACFEKCLGSTKIVLVYFSATEVTKTYAGVIAEELIDRGCEARLLDVTPYSARQARLPVEDCDGLIFGFPVFSDFAPSVIDEWLAALDGKGKSCSTFFTYGGRTTGYAHFHTKSLLEEAGFRVRFSAEFLGRHTFNIVGWRVLPDRPDARDFTVAREFAALALERFTGDVPEAFFLQKPFAYDAVLEMRQREEKSAERGWCHPVRSAGECSMCRRCEAECPNRAFDADAGLSDPLRCIECMHCVYICPDKALQIDARMKGAYQSFLKKWCLTEEMMQAKESRIITSPKQAAC